MALPGRRRANTFSIINILYLLFLLFSPSAEAVSAVLGIDIGTEYIKGVLVKPGIPLDIVLTKDSKRKEAAAIAFKPNVDTEEKDQLAQRLYGGDALAIQPRYPTEVYPNLKPLLGSVLDTRDDEQSYRQRYPSLDLIRDREGFLGFRGKAFDQEQPPVTIEELLAMELSNIKQNAKAMAGTMGILKAVITVPAYYTVDEKRAVELAADMAGLSVMSLISDGLSVGLHYATSRSFPNIDKGEKPEHHLVYDMGAGSTTATVLRVQARAVKDVGKFNKTVQEVSAIGNGWDRTLGGDSLNDIIMNDMIEKFLDSKEAKSKDVQAESIRGHGRTMAKLWKEAERLRQVLSANSATSANFEGLYDDVDFKYKLSRADFEALASSYFERVAVPLKIALANANLEMKDLDSIVLHGGVVRTPSVQKTLETLVGDPAKLRGNVNADEAAAFGAAYKAAGLSPSFRVKDIKSYDAANYQAAFTWSPKDKPRQQTIFVPTSSTGTVKQMPFNVSENFELDISQQIFQAGSDKLLDRPIWNVKITNLTDTVATLIQKHGCEKDSIKTTLSMKLDPMTGLPGVSGGASACEIDTSDKKGGVMDGVKGLFGLGGDKEQKPLDDKVDQSSSSEGSSKSTTSPSSATSTASSRSSASSSSSAKNTSEPAKSTKKTYRIPLAIESIRTDQRQPSKNDVSRMKDRLSAFDKSDKQRVQREEAFNSLEAFTYRTRDLLSDEAIVAVSTAQQREPLEKQLEKVGEWLHSDEEGGGATAGIELIKEKHKGLKSLLDPITKRKEEVANRQAALEQMEQSFNRTQALIDSVRDQVKQAAEAASLSASRAAESSSLTETPAGKESDATPDSSAEGAEDATESKFSASSDTTSSSSAPTTTEAPSASPSSPFSEADIAELHSFRATAMKWLQEKKQSQDALPPHEDPVLTSDDIKKRTQELNDAVAELIMKQMNKEETASKSKAKGGKTKAKTSVTKSSKSSPSSSSSASLSSPSLASTGTDSADSSGHSEL
ncbi:MAG: lumenal Hsp70 protein [Alyxoria varia]|nr:MAG: lumenal Hsp70 protein [Alyxoria varia]